MTRLGVMNFLNALALSEPSAKNDYDEEIVLAEWDF
jgi:hypothetical protein